MSVELFLKLLNIFVFVLVMLPSFFDVQSIYIDSNVLLTSFLTFILLHVALLQYKKNYGALIAAIVFVFVVFFQFRLFTLNISDFSLVFKRLVDPPITVDHVTNYMLIQLLFLTSLLLGIVLGGELISSRVSKNTTSISPVRKVAFITYGFYYILAGLVFFMISKSFLDLSAVGKIVEFFTKAFNYEMILAGSVVTYHFLPKRSGKRRVLLFSIVCSILVMLSQGGAGPLLRVGIPLMAAMLIVRKELIIPKKVLVIVALVLLSTTYFGTVMKYSSSQGDGLLTRLQKTEQVQSNIESGLVLNRIFARAGFLDFSVEILARSQTYSRYINLSKYFQASTDALSPGFDFFDVPLVSNGLRGAYVPSFPEFPSRAFVSSNYHSDQLNAFSDVAVLFGWIGGAFFVFLFGFFASMILASLIKRGSYFSSFLAACLINYTWVWLRGFGLDHFVAITLFEIIVFLVIFLLTFFLLRCGTLRTHIVSPDYRKKG